MGIIAVINVHPFLRNKNHYDQHRHEDNVDVYVRQQPEVVLLHLHVARRIEFQREEYEELVVIERDARSFYRSPSLVLSNPLFRLNFFTSIKLLFSRALAFQPR